MSQTMQPAPQPPGPPAPVGAPPGAIPNPAFAQWMQANQQRQAVIAENAQKQQQFDAACALIRSDGIRGFKLDIEADSTIAPDEDAEKASRVEFVQQIVPLVERVAPVIQGNAPMAAFVKEVVMFAVRGFRVARTLEEAAEKAFDAIGQMPPIPPKTSGGAKADPAIEKAKIVADVHDTQVRAQTDQAVAQAKAQTDQAAIAQKERAAVLAAQTAAQKTAAQQEHDMAKLMLEQKKMELQHEQHEDTLAAQSAGRMDA